MAPQLIAKASEARKTMLKFNSSLKGLKLRLIRLRVYFDYVMCLNKPLSSLSKHPSSESEEFVRVFTQSQELLRECCCVKWWNIHKMAVLCDKIEEQNRVLDLFFPLKTMADMMVKEVRHRIASGLNSLGKDMKELSEKLDMHFLMSSKKTEEFRPPVRCYFR